MRTQISLCNCQSICIAAQIRICALDRVVQSVKDIAVRRRIGFIVQVVLRITAVIDDLQKRIVLVYHTNSAITTPAIFLLMHCVRISQKLCDD